MSIVARKSSPSYKLERATETLAQAAQCILVPMSDDLADWIAEEMWRTTRRVGNRPPAAHVAWLDLTEAEKHHWRTMAKLLLDERAQPRAPDLP